MQQHSKSKVCYYYDSDIGNYYYGQVSEVTCVHMCSGIGTDR